MRWLRSKLGRVTSSGRFIPEIDGLRFVAVAAVLAFHINGEYLKEKGALFSPAPGGVLLALMNSLHFGVQLFFVISGFVLGLPFVRYYCHGGPRPRLRSYYYRRMTRIEPPFLINLLLIFVLLVLVKKIPLASLVPHLIASSLYSHNLIYQRMSDVNFVTWSLEIEAQFYLFAPALALLLSFRSSTVRWGLVVGLCVLSSTLANLAGSQIPWFHLTIAGQLPFFLAGFMVAGWYTQSDRSSESAALRWDLAALLAWTGMATLLLNASYVSTIALPFAVAGTYISMLKGKIFRAALSLPVITIVGGMCYTIYLYHPFLKSALKHGTFGIRVSEEYWLNLVFQVGVLGGLIVAIASLFFVLFERPFMIPDWPSRLWTRVTTGKPEFLLSEPVDGKVEEIQA